MSTNLHLQITELKCCRAMSVNSDFHQFQVLVALNQGEDKSAISPDSLFRVLFQFWRLHSWYWPKFYQGYLESCAKISWLSTAGINHYFHHFKKNSTFKNLSKWPCAGCPWVSPVHAGPPPHWTPATSPWCQTTSYLVGWTQTPQDSS